MPEALPLFPLAGALLLPRRPIQLTVFEPRYLDMLDDALTGERLIGVIQPLAGDDGDAKSHELFPVGCAGRIVQYAEIGDERCFLTLMGVARFRVARELAATARYRSIVADYSDFADDFKAGLGEKAVDRKALVDALRAFAEANEVGVDWDDIEKASNETLVNALSMMSPYGEGEAGAAGGADGRSDPRTRRGANPRPAAVLGPKGFWRLVDFWGRRLLDQSRSRRQKQLVRGVGLAAQGRGAIGGRRRTIPPDADRDPRFSDDRLQRRRDL